MIQLRGVSLSDHCHSAIYVDGLACQIARFITCKINSSGGNIFGRSEPRHRHFGENPLALLLVHQAKYLLLLVVEWWAYHRRHWVRPAAGARVVRPIGAGESRVGGAPIIRA